MMVNAAVDSVFSAIRQPADFILLTAGAIMRQLFLSFS